MKLKIKILSLALLFPFFTFAQNFEAGLSFGLMTYQGDLVEGMLEWNEINLSSGLVLRGAVTERISIKGTFFGGTLSGDDANASSMGKQRRALRFTSKIYEIGVSGEWNIFGQDRTTVRGGVERQKFTPYIMGGIAAIIFDPEAFKGDVIDPEGTDYSTVSVAGVLGGGFKFGLDERIVVTLEGGGRMTASDYLDGISKLAGPAINDWYFMGNIMVTYTFGSPSYF